MPHVHELTPAGTLHRSPYVPDHEHALVLLSLQPMAFCQAVDPAVLLYNAMRAFFSTSFSGWSVHVQFGLAGNRRVQSTFRQVVQYVRDTLSGKMGGLPVRLLEDTSSRLITTTKVRKPRSKHQSSDKRPGWLVRTAPVP